jgi:NADPH2:quinone reductase
MNDGEKMRAAWFEKFGSAKDVLTVGEIDKPSAGPGEVLVRLHASGVNPSDVKKRAGSFPDLLDGGPVVPNSDGAGVIESVGEGVPHDRIGERVWIYQAQFVRRLGTAADYIAIESARAPGLSDKAGFEVGACLGIPAMTAHRCVFSDGDVAGKTILVTGGAGRVGHYAIQWASQAGAKVIATASKDSDVEACKDAGAASVVNHRSERFAAAVLDSNEGAAVDRIVDVEFGANLPHTLDAIRTGGVIATYSSTVVPQPELPFFRMMYKDLTVRFVIVYAMPEDAKRLAVADIGNALDNNSLTHRIAKSLPLTEIVSSNELVEQGKIRGCVILTTN